MSNYKNNDTTEVAAAGLAGCMIVILALLGNIIFWGGLLWFGLWSLRQFGVIG